ncbi:DNA topoisomerase 2-associated protein pat1 [Entomophthora muscae]|uniref:DNA topoisomerase 2-associated protein pat1 n=1 Tax=Entomophthora muscae TaxID=34485 RepID=A0ACC2SS62_9FUNG|nr:DNA topoisomerase 2-associated protein pat1 [Entomophthora muscae]
MSKPSYNQEKGRQGRPGRGNKRRGGPSGDNFRAKDSFPISDGISSFDVHTFEDGDLNNDETFGGALDNLDQEFDFSGTSQIYFEQEKPTRISAPPGFPKQPLHQANNKGMLFSQYPDMMDPRIENPLQSRSVDLASFNISQAGNAQSKALSLAEVEAALLESIQPEPVKEVNPYTTYTVDWDTIFAERRLKRAIMNQRMANYEGIMCRSDKDFITRIQLSQLVTSSQSLALDDYYYRTFLTMKLPAVPTGPNFPESRDSNSAAARGKSKENQIARMQRQITKIVAESRRRQKTYPVGLENALGKVSSKSTRNPKQVLQVLHQKPGPEQSGTSESSGVSTPGLPSQSLSSGSIRGRIPGLKSSTQTPRERKMTIKTIEKLYDLTLEAEYLSRNSPPTQIETPDDQERLEEWSQSFEKVCIGLWDTLGISEDKSPGSIVHILNVAKGKKGFAASIEISHPRSRPKLLNCASLQHGGTQCVPQWCLSPQRPSLLCYAGRGGTILGVTLPPSPKLCR